MGRFQGCDVEYVAGQMRAQISFMKGQAKEMLMQIAEQEAELEELLASQPADQNASAEAAMGQGDSPRLRGDVSEAPRREDEGDGPTPRRMRGRR